MIVLKKILIALLAILLLVVVSPMVLADEFDDAEYVSFNSWIYGEITDDDEFDYYCFEIDKAGKIEFEFESDNSYLGCRIYDAAKNHIESYRVKETSPIYKECREFYLTAGKYYIQFNSGHLLRDFGKYKVKFKYIATNESFVEKQNGDNNDIASADSISLNTYYIGHLSENDEYDYYRFVLNEAAKIEIKFETDIKLVGFELFDAKEHLEEYNSTAIKPQSMELSAGLYYINFNCDFSGNNGEYRFAICTDGSSPSDSKPATQSKVTTTMSSSTVYLKEGETFNFSGTVDTTSSKGLKNIRFNLTKENDLSYGIKFFEKKNVGSKSYNLKNLTGNITDWTPYIKGGATLYGWDEGNNYVSCKLEPGTRWRLRLYATDNEGSVLNDSYMDTIIVIQESEKKSLSVSKSELSFDYKGASQTLKITSDTNYVISPSEAWITTSNISGSGNKTITVSCKENTSTSSRSGYITIATSDYDTYCYVQVTQKGKSTNTSDDSGCKHYWIIKRSSYTKYEQISGNDSYHNAVTYYDHLCDECYKVMEEDVRGTAITEAHSFSGNKCVDCGYTKSSVDTTPPSISLSVSPNKTTFTGETVTFTANVSENQNLSMVYAELDGVWISGKHVNGTSFTLTTSVYTASLTNGTHYLVIYVQDAAGNKNSKTYTFTKSATAPFPAAKSDYPWALQEYIDFLNLVNTYRSWYGAAPLKLDASLTLAANEVAGKYMNGETINGYVVQDAVDRFNAGYWYRGVGNYGYKTAQDLFTQHAIDFNDDKTIIVNTAYTKLGIALNHNSSGTPYWYFIYA